jgi:hypothetical protein
MRWFAATKALETVSGAQSREGQGPRRRGACPFFVLRALARRSCLTRSSSPHSKTIRRDDSGRHCARCKLPSNHASGADLGACQHAIGGHGLDSARRGDSTTDSTDSTDESPGRRGFENGTVHPGIGSNSRSNRILKMFNHGVKARRAEKTGIESEARLPPILSVPSVRSVVKI